MRRGKVYPNPLVYRSQPIVWAIVTSMVVTWNSMCSSEILDKYHSCCIENGKISNPTLMVFSLLPMLLLVQIKQLKN